MQKNLAYAADAHFLLANDNNESTTNMRKFWLSLIFFALAALSLVFAQSPEPITATKCSLVTGKGARVDEILTYHVQVSFADPSYMFVPDTLILPPTSGLKYMGHALKTTASASSYTTTYIFNYTPTFNGKVMLSDGFLRFLHRNTDDTTRIDTLVVQYPGFSTEAAHKRFDTTWLPAAGFFALGILLLLTVFFVLRRFEHTVQKIAARKETAKTPQEIALEALSQIKPAIMAQSEVVNRLQSALKAYVANAYNIPAPTLSTQETLQKLRTNWVTEYFITVYAEILEFCDDYRFAPHDVEQEKIIELIAKTRELIRKS